MGSGACASAVNDGLDLGLPCLGMELDGFRFRCVISACCLLACVWFHVGWCTKRGGTCTWGAPSCGPSLSVYVAAAGALLLPVHVAQESMQARSTPLSKCGRGSQQVFMSHWTIPHPSTQLAACEMQSASAWLLMVWQPFLLCCAVCCGAMLVLLHSTSGAPCAWCWPAHPQAPVICTSAVCPAQAFGLPSSPCHGISRGAACIAFSILTWCIHGAL